MARKRGRPKSKSTAPGVKSARGSRAGGGRGYGRGGVGRSFGQAGGARGGAGGGLFGMLSSLFGGAAHGGGMGGGGMGGGGGAAPFTGLSSSAEGRFVPPSMTTHPQFIPPGLTLVDMLQADPEGKPFGPGGVWDVAGGGIVSSGRGAGAEAAQAPMVAPRMAVQQAPISGFGGASGGGGGITPQPTSGTHRWGGARGTNWANNPNNPNSAPNQVAQEGANQIFRQTTPTNQFSSTGPGNISAQGRIVRTGQASPGVTGTYNAPKNDKPPKQVGGRPVT